MKESTNFWVGGREGGGSGGNQSARPMPQATPRLQAHSHNKLQQPIDKKQDGSQGDEADRIKEKEVGRV